MADKRYLKLVYDVTFKYFIKTKGGRFFLNRLVYLLTNIDVSNYYLCNTELNNVNGKTFVTDLLLINDNKEIIINIELNNYNDITYHKYVRYRNLAYLCKSVGDNFYKGKRTPNFKIIQINLNTFYCYESKIISNLNYKLEDSKKNIYLTNINIINLYLSRYKNICYNGVNELETLLSVIMVESFNELDKVLNNYGKKDEIMTELEFMAASKDIIGLYDKEEEEERLRSAIKDISYQDGKEEGREEGSVYNVPIGVDTLEEGIPKNWTLNYGYYNIQNSLIMR